MPNVNKRKGKYFEDKIAEDYRKIFNISKLDCYRSSNSGARESIEYNGDITFKDPNKYNLITECKFYKTLELSHIFPICNCYIDEWITQVYKEQEHYISEFNKIPLSIIIASKPYLKNYYIIILNEDIKLDSFIKIVFYSNKYKKLFNLITYNDLNKVFKQFNLL